MCILTMSAAGVRIGAVPGQVFQAPHAGVGDKYEFAGFSVQVFPFQTEKIGGFVKIDGKFRRNVSPVASSVTSSVTMCAWIS